MRRKATVDLTGVSHTWPDDIDIMLVWLGGQNILLMSDAGGEGDISNLNFTFYVAATTTLADEAQLVGGIFRPSNYETSSIFFPDTSADMGIVHSLTVFNNSDPNGTWSLYVRDDVNTDSGSISGGWTLHISTTVGAGCGTPTSTQRQCLGELRPFRSSTYVEDESQLAKITVTCSNPEGI